MLELTYCLNLWIEMKQNLKIRSHAVFIFYVYMSININYYSGSRANQQLVLVMFIASKMTFSQKCWQFTKTLTFVYSFSIALLISEMRLSIYEIKLEFLNKLIYISRLMSFTTDLFWCSHNITNMFWLFCSQFCRSVLFGGKWTVCFDEKIRKYLGQNVFSVRAIIYFCVFNYGFNFIFWCKFQ